MSDNVHWVIEVNIKDGQLDAFKALANEMSKATKAEDGTLAYEWYISDDGKHCHIYERYADSAAAMVHLANFGAKFAERFLACGEPGRFVVYGNANDDVRAGLAPMGAVHMSQIAGFVR
jgi:quinol monooxygenase YgiN